MIESRTDDNKLFKIIFMKETDYVMKIVMSWMNLEELEGENTRRYFMERSGTKET